ncbi:DUF4304 domain-containing protein [Aestuariibaculum sp. YM273]|uniref:DUF4304 domain-containing protein n=1 Tax=Aestuariibaculum sp. YM273 TaxID=3070659 RepID=UPI0027DB10A1|nr:DUF4304 domain-containing protein [Aestuariibaculum sp. YM273]WMI64794.1 DUF4304 domain-containing protein [Aestuariibaculum sp. YM273]
MEEWNSHEEYMNYFNFIRPFHLKTSEFKKIITKNLSPKIRKLGFSGSGFKFIKKIDNGYVHIFELTATKYGGGCEIFVGVHLDFLPASYWLKKNINKMNIHDCFLVKRITLPNDNPIFYYGNTENEAIETTEYILQAFNNHGLTFLNNFTNFPLPFDKINLEKIMNKSVDFLNQENILDGQHELSIVRILQKINQTDEAKKIVNYLFENNKKLKDNFAFKPLFDRILNDNIDFFYNENEIEELTSKIKKAIANIV